MKPTPETKPVKKASPTEEEYLAFFAACIEEGLVIIFGDRVVNFKMVSLVRIIPEERLAVLYSSGVSATIQFSDIGL